MNGIHGKRAIPATRMGIAIMVRVRMVKAGAGETRSSILGRQIPCLGRVEGILAAKNSNRSPVVSIELIRRLMTVRIDGY